MHLGFASSSLLCRHRSLLHPERRCASVIGRAGLRNLSHSRSYTGRGRIMFLGSARATAQVRHHGSSSLQVRWRGVQSFAIGFSDNSPTTVWPLHRPRSVHLHRLSTYLVNYFDLLSCLV